MVEGSSQIHREETDAQETLPFSEFNSEHLLHLTKWTKSHGERSYRSWWLKAANGIRDFSVHIRRDSLSGEHPELNMISIFSQQEGFHILVVLNRIERFGLKDNSEKEPDSKKSLFFFDSEGGSVEVRNDGEVIALRPTRVTMNGDLSSGDATGLST